MTVPSCTAFGMLLGSVGLRAKDVFFAANLAYFLMLLFCGVNIPLRSCRLDERLGRCLPLTHGIAAARQVAGGASLGDVAGLVLTEFGIAVAYAAAGFRPVPDLRAGVPPRRSPRRLLRTGSPFWGTRLRGRANDWCL